VPALIALAAVAAYVVIARWTTVGRYFLAVGGNASAAYIAGVPVQRAKMLAYIGTGFMAALAGLIETARLGATDPANIGLNMEFAAIAGAVIGGTALSGGRARLLGTVAGALILVVISTSLNMLGLSTAWTYLVQAVIILAAVAIQRVRSA
jgi:ribose/xylose/arabinose/galactoside ABC-type transport system permease subunit